MSFDSGCSFLPWHSLCRTLPRLREKEQGELLSEQIEVVIVGGGPAGLSAALLLGRCRRWVLICDTGHPRNAASPAMHGFLGRDGVSPQEFLSAARAELHAYKTITFCEDEVLAVTPLEDSFAVAINKALLREDGVC